jgi:hypothetical protein
MAEPEHEVRASELLARYKARHGPRLGEDRDALISLYFQTYIARAGRVMELAEGLSGTAGRLSLSRKRKEEAYWILEKSRGLEREHPWLRLDGFKAPPVLGFGDLPGPEERERVYERIKDKVYLLDSLLGGLEEDLDAGFSFGVRQGGGEQIPVEAPDGEPPAGDGLAGGEGIGEG